ncbi:MAG: bifunctional adenosylcobinamide kinase/adenosylcobinamide-phosphate guanylyltransferase [Candidatus Adiutrix sp.]|jgi:adenosylcobinamide kinase/adenosylcobinamide-phosphate guanylyltransferase|nr:bifunctional adenosylcobinamide kinase/adenosylcobinamide-phosphate guanylyltransferase [Candidatus Adiutrix sp.]
MGQLTLYLGGAKSGKTSLALARAETWPPPRLYLATAQALDGEMAERIRRHQAERGPQWQTLESPLTPDQTLADLAGDQVFLLDCLTLWLNNLLAVETGDDQIRSRVRDLLLAIDAYAGPVIAVSNEVGGGIVPINALARRFRDLAGETNQRFAARADRVVMAVAGLEWVLKSPS